MATPVEKLLCKTLYRDADYKTIQLLKVGQIAQAAVIVLKSRRRAIVFPSLALFGLALMGLFAQAFVTALTGSPNVSSGNSLVILPMIGLTVLILIQMHVALSRLETLLMIWLQENPEPSSEGRDELWQLLAKTSFGRH